MKKLFLILLSFFALTSYGQAEYEKLKITENVSSLTAPNVNVQETDGVINYRPLAGLPFAQSDTGVLTFASPGISVASGTQVNIGAVTGYIVDNETNPAAPTRTYVNYTGETNKTVTTIGGGLTSYILLSSTGVISFQNTFPTSAERKVKIWLGKVAHPLGVVTVAGPEPDFITSPLSQHRDLFQALGPYINDGVIPYPNGANLSINVTNGNIHGDGINFVVSRTNPGEISVVGAPITFLPRTQTGNGGVAITNVDVGNYDVAGTITAVPGAGARSTIRYIYYIPNLGFIIQYGQQWYGNINDAVANVGKESQTIYPPLANNSILVGVLVSRKDATLLNDVNQARFFPASKLGEIIGATSGVSTGTLQTAYNNSLTPQITTSTALGAVTVRNGSASDTNNILVGQNIAGANTFTVDGNGLVKSGATTLNANPATANNDLVRKDYADTKLNKTYESNFDIADNTSTISGTTFDAFGILVQTFSNKLISIYREGAGHLSNDGKIVMRTSTDGGKTFSARSIIHSEVAGVDCRNVGGGVTPTGRIIIFFLKVNNVVPTFYSQGTMYSDDDGVTWSAYTPQTYPVGSTFYSPYGNLIAIANDRLLLPYYSISPSGGIASMVKFSDDNGLTWGGDVTVGTDPTNGYNETSFAYLDGGTILAVARKTDTSVLRQFLSTNNGATWTDQGNCGLSESGLISPWLNVYRETDGEKYVSLFYTAKAVVRNILAISASRTSVIAGASGWIPETKKTVVTGSGSGDFGYPSFVNPRFGKKMLGMYYTSPDSSNQLSAIGNYTFFNYQPSAIYYKGSNTGFGTNNPNWKTHIDSGSGNNYISLTNSNTGSGVNDGVLFGVDMASGVQLYNRENTDIQIATNNTERFRFHANGGISIGNTTSLGAGTLNVTGNITTIAATTANHAVTLGQIGVIPKKYVALLTQTGTGAPTATVLDNTLGATVSYSYNSAGNYTGTLSSPILDVNKTAIILGINQITSGGCRFQTANTVTIVTTANGNLSNTTLEIRVYP